MTATCGNVSSDASRTVDPFDPVALEARLAEARVRRMSALAERSAAARNVPPPAPATAGALPPRPFRLLHAAMSGRLAVALAGAIVGAGLVATLASSPAPEPPAVAVAPTVAAAPAPVVAAAPAPLVAPSLVSASVVATRPPAEVITGPAPRPVGHTVAAARPSGPAVRSARNAPRAVTPPQAVGLVVRDINRATVGRTAAALGVRERLTVPGVPLAVTLDRRGLRLHERRLRGRR